jgi:hypothetical protein
LRATQANADLPATRLHRYAKRCGQVLRMALQAGC